MKTSRKNNLLAGAFMAVLTLASPLAYGQATRTWVSGVGDDANPCSRTAPGKTFAGAISKTATGGEIDCLDPGGFGAVTIIKSITIDGQGTMGSILAAGSNGIIINATPTSVITLRNLSINGFTTGLTGIKILNAAEVNIENCVIFEFSQLGIDINTPGSCRVNIKDTIIRGCTQSAIHSRPTGGGAVVTITDSSMLNNSNGFQASDRTTATLNRCLLSGSPGSGVLVSTSSVASRVLLNDCVASDNSAGGLSSVGALSSILFSNTSVVLNATGVFSASGGSITSFGNNRINGNTNNGVPTSTIGQQ